MDMDNMIECRTMTGTRIVPKEKLQFRPAVYGVVISDGKLLLTKMRSTGKYWLPGGGVDLGETLERAVKREIWEECGIDVEVRKPIFFGQSFFYYEPEDAAWQTHLFICLCSPKTFELQRHDLHDESVDPQWVDIALLRAHVFQDWGEEIMEYLKTCDSN